MVVDNPIKTALNMAYYDAKFKKQVQSFRRRGNRKQALAQFEKEAKVIGFMTPPQVAARILKKYPAKDMTLQQYVNYLTSDKKIKNKTEQIGLAILDSQQLKDTHTTDALPDKDRLDIDKDNPEDKNKPKHEKGKEKRHNVLGRLFMRHGSTAAGGGLQRTAGDAGTHVWHCAMGHLQRETAVAAPENNLRF